MIPKKLWIYLITKGDREMPVKVNPLTLQHLFYDILDELEYAQNCLYNDKLSQQMKNNCKKNRLKYEKRLHDLMRQY